MDIKLLISVILRFAAYITLFAIDARIGISIFVLVELYPIFEK